MTAHWAAHLPSQPITGLQFRSSEHLFSSGHMAGASLTVWNVSKHLTGENVKSQPLAQYSRRRQKQGGKIFSTVLCPEEKSAMVLVGGERGGPQGNLLIIEKETNKLASKWFSKIFFKMNERSEANKTK